MDKAIGIIVIILAVAGLSTILQSFSLGDTKKVELQENLNTCEIKLKQTERTIMMGN